MLVVLVEPDVEVEPEPEMNQAQARFDDRILLTASVSRKRNSILSLGGMRSEVSKHSCLAVGRKEGRKEAGRKGSEGGGRGRGKGRQGMAA